ncbi:hypothetical protein FBU30_008880 [Linnemannia zychae]|nr:hypothetical protein FBU30_008880 [Linnemannia zychae]
MGAKHSKENKDLARRTHFSKREINTLRREFEKTSSATRSNVLTEAQFKEARQKGDVTNRYFTRSATK